MAGAILDITHRHRNIQKLERANPRVPGLLEQNFHMSALARIPTPAHMEARTWKDPQTRSFPSRTHSPRLGPSSSEGSAFEDESGGQNKIKVLCERQGVGRWGLGV